MGISVLQYCSLCFPGGRMRNVEQSKFLIVMEEKYGYPFQFESDTSMGSTTKPCGTKWLHWINTVSKKCLCQQVSYGSAHLGFLVFVLCGLLSKGAHARAGRYTFSITLALLRPYNLTPCPTFSHSNKLTGLPAHENHEDHAKTPHNEGGKKKRKNFVK